MPDQVRRPNPAEFEPTAHPLLMTEPASCCRWGGMMVGVGVLSALLLETLLGGFSPTGRKHQRRLVRADRGADVHSLSADCCWRSGVAKWLRNRSMARRQ